MLEIEEEETEADKEVSFEVAFKQETFWEKNIFRNIEHSCFRLELIRYILEWEDLWMEKYFSSIKREFSI